MRLAGTRDATFSVVGRNPWMGVHLVMEMIVPTSAWYEAEWDTPWGDAHVLAAKLVKAGVLVPRRNKLDRRWRLAKGVTLEHARAAAEVLFA